MTVIVIVEAMIDDSITVDDDCDKQEIEDGGGCANAGQHTYTIIKHKYGNIKELKKMYNIIGANIWIKQIPKYQSTSSKRER